MDKKLRAGILKLHKGDKVKINGKIYAINRKDVHKAKSKYESDSIIYSLGSNCFLEVVFNEPVFYKNIGKKGFLGFTATKSSYTKIKNIQIC